MRDSDSDREEHYPFHQPVNRGEERHHPFEDADALEEKPRHKSQGPLHQREEVPRPELPRGRFQRSLSIGTVIGILCVVQSIALTFADASNLQTVSNLGSKTPYTVALTVFGFTVLSFFIALLLFFIGGIITGRVAVHRRLGFLSGFVAGIIYYAVAIFLVRYIPNYPGNLSSSATTNVGATATGLIIALIFLIVWGIIGGLFSLLGAWLATRRHPYYGWYPG